MDAVQYLANLASNRSYDEEYPKIKLDIEGYRARREETLRRLANRTAQKALKFKRNFALEPMNPYERRIIHSELQKVAGVSTHSVGSGNGRRVIVTFGDAQ
jgi:spoIIIJ-associated protein